MSRILPILFNTEMVKAILDGKKTETRRLVTKKFIIQPDQEINQNGKGRFELYNVMPRCGIPQNIFFKPPYQPEDILYVRETWGWDPCWDCGLDTEKNACPYEHGRIYNQKNREYGCYCYKASMDDGDTPSVGTWHPSIHMPKAAARIWLKVTDVRVERLQDIDGQEVLKEGINSHVHPKADYFNMNQREAFEELWNSTLKKADQDLYGWDANPWVWVIEFERCDKPKEWGV